MAETFYPKNSHIFFKEVLDLIKETLDPEFIILTGSFGKDSWLFDKEKLISDIEIIFVCKKKWSVYEKKQLVKRLNNKYPYKIELKGFLKGKIEKKIMSNYASRNSGYISLNFFDAFKNPKYLYKKNNNILNIDISVEEIPFWEAWRLYVNRMGDILKIDCSSNFDQQTAKYYWLKMFESTADAYCIINGIYDKNISKRLILFNKGLIEHDKELSDTCKNSFSIIQSALEARKLHDLSIFDIKLSIFERKEIVSSWMQYFERKMGQQEEIIIDKEFSFYDNYLKRKSLQRKYLDFDNGLSIILTNTLKLITNNKKLSYPFKFYTQNYSWRHVILLCISSLFYEYSVGNTDFKETKRIASKIVHIKKLDNLKNEGFIQSVLNYWKVIR